MLSSWQNNPENQSVKWLEFLFAEVVTKPLWVEISGNTYILEIGYLFVCVCFDKQGF